MGEDSFAIGELLVRNTQKVISSEWYQRNDREYIDGKAMVYHVSGPHSIDCELHYIKLANGEKWVEVGENFSGPKWLWKQTKGRLRMSVTKKKDKFSFDLPLPTPSSRNQDSYTMSCASEGDIESYTSEFRELLAEHGVEKIGTRADLFGDKSSRKKYISTILKEQKFDAPIAGYCISRLYPLVKVFEKLRENGDESFEEYVLQTSVKSDNSDNLDKIIATGETAYVEFKPAIWYDHGRAENDPNYNPKKEDYMSHNIIKTVAGFLNADGGTLFVGVSDSGSSNGLLEDVELTKRKDLDGLENELNQLISNAVSKEISATKVRISFPEFQSKTIAKIDVKKSNAPVFMKSKKHEDKFFVRIGNATNNLSVESAFNYISNHDWHD